MRTKTALTGLLVAAVITGSILGWALRSSVRAGDSASSNPLHPETAKIRPEPDSSPPLASPDAAVRALVETDPQPGDQKPTVWDAFEILDQAIGPDPNALLSPDEFEARYEGATEAQIRIAHAAAESKLGRERTRITADLLAQGRYTETIQTANDPSPFPRATKERPIVSFGFQIEHGDGFDKVRTAEIDPAEFPEFYALEQEYHWLGGKLKGLDKQKSQ